MITAMKLRMPRLGGAPVAGAPAASAPADGSDSGARRETTFLASSTTISKPARPAVAVGKAQAGNGSRPTDCIASLDNSRPNFASCSSRNEANFARGRHVLSNPCCSMNSGNVCICDSPSDDTWTISVSPDTTRSIALDSVPTRSVGVPSGSANPRHPPSDQFVPCSENVGTSGKPAARFGAITPKARTLPDASNALASGKLQQTMSRPPLINSCSEGPAPCEEIHTTSST